MEIDKNLEELYQSLYIQAKPIEMEQPTNNGRTWKRKETGIYFLYFRGVVVYVGKSDWRITDRLYHHKYKQKKRFEYQTYISLPKMENSVIELAENYFINLFNPYYNVKNRDYTHYYKLKDSYKKDRAKVNMFFNHNENNEKYIYSYNEGLKNED